ncbi:hypothetical protein CBL_01713 [Carabus blaptoides fortunei]
MCLVSFNASCDKCVTAAGSHAGLEPSKNVRTTGIESGKQDSQPSRPTSGNKHCSNGLPVGNRFLSQSDNNPKYSKPVRKEKKRNKLEIRTTSKSINDCQSGIFQYFLSRDARIDSITFSVAALPIVPGALHLVRINTNREIQRVADETTVRHKGKSKMTIRCTVLPIAYLLITGFSVCKRMLNRRESVGNVSASHHRGLRVEQRWHLVQVTLEIVDANYVSVARARLGLPAVFRRLDRCFTTQYFYLPAPCFLVYQLDLSHSTLRNRSLGEQCEENPLNNTHKC